MGTVRTMYVHCTYSWYNVRTMYVQCTYSWYNVRTMYVHCTYSARWEGASDLSCDRRVFRNPVRTPDNAHNLDSTLQAVVAMIDLSGFV